MNELIQSHPAQASLIRHLVLWANRCILWLAQHWLAVFNGFFALYVGLASAWLHFMPMSMLWAIGLIAMGLTSTILHSRRYLTWHSYLFFAAGPLALIYLQYFGHYQSNWTLRTLTGIIFGVGMVWYAYPHLEAYFSQVRHQANLKLERASLTYPIETEVKRSIIMSLSNLNPQTSPAATQAPPTIQPNAARAAQVNHWFAQHWLLTFNTAWGIFVTLPWLAPTFMALGLNWPGQAIYLVYSFFCHQLPERSWFLFGPAFSYTKGQIAQAWGLTLPQIGHELIRRQFIGTPELGWKVAWSDRMVALFTSIFLFGLLYALLRQRGIRLKGISPWLLLFFTLPLALDGTTHLINYLLQLDFRDTNEWAVVSSGGIFPADFYAGDMWGSLNSVLRIASGFLFGFGIVGFLWPLMDREFSPRRQTLPTQTVL